MVRACFNLYSAVANSEIAAQRRKIPPHQRPAFVWLQLLRNRVHPAEELSDQVRRVPDLVCFGMRGREVDDASAAVPDDASDGVQIGSPRRDGLAVCVGGRQPSAAWRIARRRQITEGVIFLPCRCL